MTPQPAPQPPAAQPGIAACAAPGSNHLTDAQFGELMARSREGSSPELALAEAHLLVCQSCAAELAGLREAVVFFREASNAYADSQLRRMPRWVMPERRAFRHGFVPAYWVAAAAMLLTALLPLQLLRWHRLQAPTAVAAGAAGGTSAADISTQSDAVLMEDVNRDISATVPTSMQALDVPTGVAASAPATTQRKD